LGILAAPQLLGLFKIVVGRLPELLLCKRVTRCSRPRVVVVRHFAKFGDRRHASISFCPTCFGATPQNPDWVPVLLGLRLCPPRNLSTIAHTLTFPRTPQFFLGGGSPPPSTSGLGRVSLAQCLLCSESDLIAARQRNDAMGHKRTSVGQVAARSCNASSVFHRQTEGSSCLAFAISALPLASLIFRFALPRLQKARALLGSSRIASLKSAMARSLSPLCAYRTPRFLNA